MVLYPTRGIPIPLAMDRVVDFHQAHILTNSSKPLELKATMLLWTIALLDLLELLSPIDGTSIFYPTVAINHLSSFSIFLYRIMPLFESY